MLIRRDFRRTTGIAVLLLTVLVAVAPAQGLDPAKLPGIVVDDSRAEFTGTWKSSTHTRPFVGTGYRHDDNLAKGQKQATFRIEVPQDGEYAVLVGYTPGANRASVVPVAVTSAEGTQTVEVNQQRKPETAGLFQSLGKFRFQKSQLGLVVVSNTGTTGHVIVDAVLVIDIKKLPTLAQALKTAPQAKIAAKSEPQSVPAPPFEPVPPTRAVAKLASADLDGLLEQHVGSVTDAPLIDDARFLRRASLDLIGRQPTLAELEQFVADTAPDKRAKAIERLLSSPEFGVNWASYWSDVIGYRQQEPELTFHDYRPFKAWLAERINSGANWDAISYEILTASGTIDNNPAATFVGFHQANPNKLAGETTRVFLGVQIHCAECHDHPFIEMPQETFHGVAAFFARTKAKIPQLDSGGILVYSQDKGEHRLPGQKSDMPPTLLSGEAVALGTSDLDRRVRLAHWIVSGDNRQFSKAFVNRVWARLMGRGFTEPVDDIGEGSYALLPEVHNSLADDFTASGYDFREPFRVVMNTQAYQRTLIPSDDMEDGPFAAARVKQLRGDEVFASLVTAVELPNVTPPRAKKTGAVRFPPPPKSTRDLTDDAFGYDPSFADENVIRTMKQAMFLMNNEQIQQQIDASPGSGTLLATLLAAEPDDEKALVTLFRRVLARKPNERELKLLLAHVENVGDRGAAFEDVLWSLINTTEFTTRP